MIKNTIKVVMLFLVFALFVACSKEDVKKYKVTFVDNGETIEVQNVEEGKSATAPVIEKEGYVVSWDKDFSNVKEDLTVNSIYTVKTLTVTFVDENDVVLKEETVEYGKPATAPNVVKEGFDFTWDKNFDNVKEDLTVKLSYTVLKFIVTFVDEEGNVLYSEEVEYGKDAKEPLIETVAGYEYFWDENFTNVKEDLTVTLIWEQISYTVTFVDQNGNRLKTENVYYGESATAPEIDSLYTVTWDKDFSNIKEDTTVTGTLVKVSCSIRYFDGIKELYLNPSTYKPGEEVVLPVPEKAGSIFEGWYLSSISLTEYKTISKEATGDYKFYARFVETEKSELITLPEAKYNFTVINKNKHSSGDFYVYQPQMPSGAPTGVTNYNWTTSDSKIATVSTWSTLTIASNGYCVLTATNKNDPTIVINCIIKTTSEGITVVSEEEANTIETVTVTFKGKNGEVIDMQTCNKGGAVIYPKPINYDGLMFTGWDKQNYNIQEDTVITATYSQGVNNYAGKTFGILGDSISTYKEYIPSGFASFYPYPTADVTDVNLTWWMQVINKIGGQLFVNNSYSGTCVADSSSNATKNKSRLKHFVIGEDTPDVILIFMGANDCASKYVTDVAFNQGYTLMLNNLKELCPKSEIILCTLPTTTYYSEPDQKIFNQIIIDHATKFELKLIDCSSVSIKDHLVDTAHPDTSGMTLVANKMIEQLYELSK